jgi:hypothetical protein
VVASAAVRPPSRRIGSGFPFNGFVELLTLRGRLRFWIFDFALLDLSLARN